MGNKNIIIRFSILVLLTIIGVILLIWGTKEQNNVYVSVGASLTCVGISLFIDSLLTQDVVEILRDFTSSKFLSEEHIIENFRKKYYAYWVTKINNQTVWWHAIYDFSNSISPGKLIADISLKSALSNERQVYYCEAIMKGDKLIFVITSKKGIEDNVVGFIRFGHVYNDTSYGIHIFESYDRNKMTAPVILSLNPIKNWTEAGKVDDAVIESFLWEEWRKNFEIYV